MLAFLHSLSWLTVLTFLITFVATYAILPNLPKLPRVTAEFFDWVLAQTKRVQNQYVEGVLSRASNVIKDIVVALENTEIEAIKAKLAAGQVTLADLPVILATVKQTAITYARENFTAVGLNALILEIFSGDEVKLISWIAGQVETHVAALPPSGLRTKA